jgi:hypothetical protein
MWLRHKVSERYARLTGINADRPDEIILSWRDADTGAESDLPANYDVQLSDGIWRDLQEAIQNHDLITDRNRRAFFEPTTAGDRVRGFTAW